MSLREMLSDYWYAFQHVVKRVSSPSIGALTDCFSAIRGGQFSALKNREDPLVAKGPCSPIWAVAPMIEVAPAPADGPGLAEMARASGAALSGLRLADGALILKVERAGRARQLRFADGDGFDPHGGSFVPSLSFGPDWPRLNGRARELWRLVGGPAPLAGRGTGTGNF